MYIGGRKYTEAWKFLDSLRRERNKTPLQFMLSELEDLHRQFLTEGRPGLRQQEQTIAEGEHIHVINGVTIK